MAALDEDSSHQRSCDNLESQSKPREETRDVAANASAHSQKASEERDDSEEESNDDEREHEPGSQVVVIGSDELMGHIVGSVEVVGAWRVEWEVWVRATTVIPTIVRHTAYVPESPARGGWSTWDVACIRLKEVDLIQRVRVTSTA